jgi:hypothetical protein
MLSLLLAGCAGPRVIWAGHDRAHLTHADVLATETEQWLRIGEAQGVHYDAIGTDGLVFSRDGARVVYPATRGRKWFVINGEQTLGPYEGVADLVVSRDGSRVAFAAETKQGWRAVVDGVPGSVYEHFQGGTLQLSESGAHVAFTGSTGTCAYIVIDDIPGPCRERVVAMRVTDLGTVAAVVREAGKERFVVQPEQKATGEAPDEIGEWVVTTDGLRTAYTARSGTRWSAIVDGVASTPCARVQYLRFGDRGKRLAWACVEGGQSSLVVDGAPGKPFLAVSPPVLASRAPDVAYIAHDGMGEWVIAGDSSSGPFSEVRQLVMPKNGGPVAFIARTDGVLRVVHQEKQAVFPMIVDGSLVVSDDGAHWAVIAGDPLKRELWLVVDGAQQRKVAPAEVFDETELHLGPWLERELASALTARSARASQ